MEAILYGAIYGVAVAAVLVLAFRIRDRRHARRELRAYLRFIRKGGER